MRFLPGPLGTKASAERTAQDFAELMGQVVNATISHAPISFTAIIGAEFGGVTGHRGAGRLPAPLTLVNGEHLFIRHSLCLRRDPAYLTTLEYEYRYQATADRTSWIWRYEYQREPEGGYPYPRCHFHVNARPGFYTGDRLFPDLHLPAGERVTFEEICRHLVKECGIGPISDAWEATLAEAEDSFREIQRRRVRA